MMNTMHRNAIAILRASHRCSGGGARSWPGGIVLSAPRRHHSGWWAFTWPEPDRKCTVDIMRHRCIAKAQARRIIAEHNSK